jgi:predicted Ser/Thr protein kinase
MQHDTLEAARQAERERDDLKAADIYLELGEWQQALRLYQALEQQYPFHKNIKFKLGQVLTQLGEWDEAIIKLQEAGQRGAFVEDTLYLLAECFKNKGFIYAAKDMYVELLERNYQYKDAKEQLRALESPGVGRLSAWQTTATQIPTAGGGDTGYQTLQGMPVEDRYVLLEELGRGGMGIVYKANDTTADRLVAIKVLPPYMADDAMNQMRFFREAEIVARLHHPHIVKILEANQQGNFLVMEYVPGGTLSTWRRQRAPSEAQIIHLLCQILDALHTVHEQGIVHRDLKPENILIADDTTAKLSDFGIAHICGATITHTGTHLGTLPYMSPEQVLGEQVDRRSDLYAVGVLLYEIFTGELPFQGRETSYQHIHTRPRPPQQLTPDLPPALNALILKCLAKQPDDRYPDALALCDALAASQAR